jgi:hypothetical protein
MAISKFGIQNHQEDDLNSTSTQVPVRVCGIAKIARYVLDFPLRIRDAEEQLRSVWNINEMIGNYFLLLFAGPIVLSAPRVMP